MSLPSLQLLSLTRSTSGRYTLGGLYFAQYDSSPAGRFDEVCIKSTTVLDMLSFVYDFSQSLD